VVRVSQSDEGLHPVGILFRQTRIGLLMASFVVVGALFGGILAEFRSAVDLPHMWAQVTRIAADKPSVAKDAPTGPREVGTGATLDQNPGASTSKTALEADAISSGTSELSHDAARRVLAEHYRNKTIQRLIFLQGGVEQATKDGLVEATSGWPVTHRFTSAGLAIVGSVLRDNAIFLDVDQSIYFVVKVPLSIIVIDVDAIEKGRSGDTRTVEYTIGYVFPERARAMARYVSSTQRGKKEFENHEGRWQIAETQVR